MVLADQRRRGPCQRRERVVALVAVVGRADATILREIWKKKKQSQNKLHIGTAAKKGIDDEAQDGVEVPENFAQKEDGGKGLGTSPWSFSRIIQLQQKPNYVHLFQPHGYSSRGVSPGGHGTMREPMAMPNAFHLYRNFEVTISGRLFVLQVPIPEEGHAGDGANSHSFNFDFLNNGGPHSNSFSFRLLPAKNWIERRQQISSISTTSRRLQVKSRLLSTLDVWNPFGSEKSWEWVQVATPLSNFSIVVNLEVTRVNDVLLTKNGVCNGVVPDTVKIDGARLVPWCQDTSGREKFGAAHCFGSLLQRRHWEQSELAGKPVGGGLLRPLLMGKGYGEEAPQEHVARRLQENRMQFSGYSVDVAFNVAGYADPSPARLMLGILKKVKHARNPVAESLVLDLDTLPIEDTEISEDRLGEVRDREKLPLWVSLDQEQHMSFVQGSQTADDLFPKRNTHADLQCDTCSPETHPQGQPLQVLPPGGFKDAKDQRVISRTNQVVPPGSVVLRSGFAFLETPGPRGSSFFAHSLPPAEKSTVTGFDGSQTMAESIHSAGISAVFLHLRTLVASVASAFIIWGFCVALAIFWSSKDLLADEEEKLKAADEIGHENCRPLKAGARNSTKSSKRSPELDLEKRATVYEAERQAAESDAENGPPLSK
ncbi:unnamed protein product [Amoebophrya sp. A120]|nr:unnamed protein product [Amoebophrya sp. A120]|eukprot:GSA120T00021811001.1